LKNVAKRFGASNGRTLASYGALLVGLSACEAALGFDRGTSAPAAEAGRGGRGSGGKGGSGGAGGKVECCSDGGTTAGGGRSSTGSGGSSGSSAGRGGAETLAAGGSGANGGTSGAPSGGSGGETPLTGDAGEGGEAGSDVGECQKNEDCPNPDPDCRAECRSTAFGNTCVIVPDDRDGDLHGSSACEGAVPPGDDCDDSRADVYKDAPELCDARDNDCDGKRDFDDGRVLSVNMHVLADAPVYDVDVAWSPSQMTWGALWNTGSATMYQPMDRYGAERIEPVAVSDYRGTYAVDAGDEPSRAVLPSLPATPTVAISWGEDALGTGAFAVAFPGGGWDVLLGLVAADGASLVPAIPLTDYYDGWGSEIPDLQWLDAQGVWAASWLDLRDNTFQPIVRTVSLTGAYGPEAYPGFGFDPRIAVAGGQLAAVWHGFDTVRGSLLSASLESAPLDIAGHLDLGYPYIAGREDRFGVVFSAPPDKFGYAEIGLDGTLICGPVLREANGFVHSDIVAVEHGFLILGGQPTVQVVEVLPGCRFGSTIEIDSTPARFVRGANGGADGLVVAWGGADRELRLRLMGPHLCD
jgi:hypothetical protein